MYFKTSTLLYMLIACICSFAFQFMHANDMSQPDFMIETWDITPGTSQIIEGTWNDSAVSRTWFALAFIIQRLLVVIWWVTLVVMSIGAWFMILHKWDDSMLSKGKDIFFSGALGLVIALSSYYIVSLVRFLIYN